MVTARESQTSPQFPASNSRNSDHMGLVQIDQNYGLPYFNPNSDLRGGLNIVQPNVVGEFFKLPPPKWNISYPHENPCLKDSQNALPQGLMVSDKPIDAPQKRFLIFDRSGNETRLFFTPSLSPQNRVIASKTLASTEKVASRVNEQFLLDPVVEEKWDENHLNDGEGEMLDDSEEIDALLYSDSDDENDYYDDEEEEEEENDEVTSMRHDVPFSFKEGYNDKDKLFDKFVEEVASCDGSPKRQRLLDGGYMKSKPSFVSFESPMNRASSFNYKDDEESRFIGAKNSHDDIDSKVKIRETLKILASLIPGLKDKDPLSVIEKAIVYFESMKIEAEALGLTLNGSFRPGQENH